MQIAYIRQENTTHIWVDLYNSITKQNFPLKAFKPSDYKSGGNGAMQEARYYATNINVVLGNLAPHEVG